MGMRGWGGVGSEERGHGGLGSEEEEDSCAQNQHPGRQWLERRRRLREREKSNECCLLLGVRGGLLSAALGLLKCCAWRARNIWRVALPVFSARCLGDRRLASDVLYTFMSVQVSQSYTHRLDMIEELQLCLDLDCGSCLPVTLPHQDIRDCDELRPS